MCGGHHTPRISYVAIHVQSLCDYKTAKRAVEIAIEQDEDAALRYIEEAQRASM